MGKCDKSEEKMFAFFDVHISLSNSTLVYKRLGGVKSADSQIGIKRWKRRELQALIPEGPAGDKTGEGWDLLRPRPPEGVAARE